MINQPEYKCKWTRAETGGTLSRTVTLRLFSPFTLSRSESCALDIRSEGQLFEFSIGSGSLLNW